MKIKQKYLIKLINESIKELAAYHGAGADFDKFNHKKYLGTGCHSQCFGWGTYITDDKAVALGYAENYSGNFYEKNLLYFNAYSLAYQALNNYFDETQFQMLNHYPTYKGAYFGKTTFFSDICRTQAQNNGNMDSQTVKYAIYFIHDFIMKYGWDMKRLKENMKYNMFSYEKKKEKLEQENNTGYNYGKLYEVIIPDNNGNNYLEWHEQVSPQIKQRILNGLKGLRNPQINQIISNNAGMFNGTFNKYIKRPLYRGRENKYVANMMNNYVSNRSNGIYSGGDMYDFLTKIFNSQKAASLFLMNMCGFDGIVYESGTIWKKPDGASEDGKNYVIFDANKIKIVNKTNI